MYKHFFKRLLDFCIALVALLCIGWFLIIIAIWLHFANKGAGALASPKQGGAKDKSVRARFAAWFAPVFFFQERPGKGSKIFRVVKFKSMTDERDADGNLLPDADRITKVGRFVRATSIDELPQLWNVLIGDMALIGPRPLLPKYMDWYTEDEKHRQDVRPGITGWAQCNGRNHCVWEERLAYDVYYVQNLSFGMDVKILFMTVMNVLKSKDIEVVPNMMDFDTYRQYVLKEAKLTLDEYSKLTQAQKMSIAKPEILTLDDVKLDDVDIKVVRDDVFNQIGGGIKSRKSVSYESALVAGGYNAAVTTGGIQSNHNRAVALMCAKHGWKCIIVYHGTRERFESEKGNALLVRLSGAECVFVEADGIASAMDNAMERLKQEGYKPYYIHGGGHDIFGGTALVDAVKLLKKQCDEIHYKPDYIFHASGTGSTQAGIAVGLDLVGWSDVKLIGISVARQQERGKQVIVEFANMLSQCYGVKKDYTDIINFNTDYLCGGYERFTDEMKEYIEGVTKTTGIAFDTTYSGKALYGMMDIVNKHGLTGNIMFWHTGGLMNIMK